MKAIVYHKYGTPDVLELAEVDKPAPADDEVLIKVHAVSINDWDMGLLDGDFINRVLNGLRKPKRKILGSDIAGRIEAIGKNIKQFKIGDEVYGDLSGQWGGFAEYVCAKEKSLALKPAAMSFEQAAAIPQAAMLAVQGLIDKGNIKQGQKLLINGAGGGVGTFGIQIAKLYGAEVTGVDNTGKLEMMRSLGFDHVIDYTKEDFTKNGKHYDLILDAKTSRSMFDYARSLNPNGIYVTVGGSIGRLFQSLLLAPLIKMIQKKHIRLVALKTNKDLAYMNELFETGKMNPIIDGPYRLDQLPEAFKYFARGEHKGKIVISIKDHVPLRLNKIGKFHIEGSFTITGRGLIATGQIIEGRVRNGSFVSLKINNEEITLKVRSVEIGDKANGSSFVGLLFSNDDYHSDLNLEKIKIEEQIVDVKHEFP